MNRSKKTNKSLAQKVALKAFSDYIRERDNFVCFTCGKKGTKYNTDAGHFISRVYASIKFDERNVHAQCVRDNQYGGGCWDVYYEKMQARYGQAVIDELQSKKNEICQRTIKDYLDLEALYKQKLAELRKKAF